ncbi:MAG: sigma-54 dependent transcriptional regulator, partial [Acidobacteriota bacterium]|nr:sigma-54 dependent transcriptional regulator [Acidobacteriota bacterium]
MSEEVTEERESKEASLPVPADRTIRLLLADDEEPLRRILGRELRRKGYEVIPAEDGRRALRLLAEEEFDVAVLDVRMPGVDGLSVLRSLKNEVSPPEVILLTGNATVELAVDAMKLGAYDFVTKPCRIEVLDALLQGAARKRGIARDNERLRRREEQREPSRCAAGWNSRAMAPVLRLIDRLAPSDLPLLILGESGVGKELVAREVHSRSQRSEGPFVDLNCAAIPDTLLESELFGHEKGSFTGAGSARAGLLEAADGGTLFLDEVGELPSGLQVKLLRVLETMSFYRVGGRRKVSVNVRLVTATNRDLATESQTGRFRADLYYRINAGTIVVPPLRERTSEIETLASVFLASVKSNASLDPQVVDAMETYSWPGNVRELRNVVERAALLCRDDTVRVEDLPLEITDRRLHPALVAA